MYSPQIAAGIADVSRKTVMNAINAGELKATRNNRNHWVISKVDLKAWMDSRGSRSVKAKKDDLKAVDAIFPGIPMAIQNSVLSVQLKADAATIIELREAITDLKIDRDEWKAHAKQLLKNIDSRGIQDKTLPLMLNSTDLYKLQKPKTDTAPETQKEPPTEPRKKFLGIF